MNISAQQVSHIIDLSLFGLIAFCVYLIVYNLIYFYGKGSLKIRVPSGLPEEQFTEDTSKLVWLAIIASTAPFIGLAGTVLNIIVALGKLSSTSDMTIIAGPIGQALYATLWGLVSAIPALVAYNFFTSKAEKLNFGKKKSYLVAPAHAACAEESKATSQK